MSYSMTTIYSGTKIREDHNTSANVLTSVNAKVTVTGSEKWTATTGGAEVFVGDVWVKVTYNGVTGWMAYVHKGQAICNNFKEVNAPPVPSEPVLYPESAVWEYVEPSTGQTKRIQYKFEKVLP